MKNRSQNRTTDMTKGFPMKLIINFSVPLLFGLLFQRCYNIVDTVIVGRFLGVNELAAVGSVGTVSFLVLGFCNGLCSGFAIPVTQRFGAGDYEEMRKYVANSLWTSAITAAAMTGIMLGLCRNILIWMQTPVDIFADAHAYIWVIFLGLPATILYNTISGVIRAVGDSKTPLYFLIISSVMNVILDIVFIVCFHWGVAGAAWATVISQAVSGILCIIFMFNKFEILRIRKGEWVPERKKMFTLYNMGLPMGLQYSITAIGSTVLQSAINGLGAVYVAATAAGTKIYSFLACPIHAMGSAMATYGGQNIGARKLDRIGKGMKACVIIGAVYSVIAFLLSITLGKYMAMLFVDPSEYEVIKSIQLYVNVTMAGGFLIALVNGIRFLIQGIGFPKIAMMAGVMEMIARIFIGFVLVPAIGYMGVALSCPIAWIFADAFLIPAYFGVMKRLRREEAANEAS